MMMMTTMTTVIDHDGDDNSAAASKATSDNRGWGRPKTRPAAESAHNMTQQFPGRSKGKLVMRSRRLTFIQWGSGSQPTKWDSRQQSRQQRGNKTKAVIQIDW